MTPLTQWLTPAVVSAFGWTLIHFLWQGLAFAILLRSLLYSLKTPTARYNAAVLALVAMTVAPAITFGVVYHQPGLSTKVGFGTQNGIAQQPVATASGLAAPAQESAASIRSWFRVLDVSRADVSRIFVWFWTIGVLAFSLRALGGWLMVRDLRRRSDEQLAPALLQTCHSLQRHLGIDRIIRFCASPSLTVPAVVGWFRPVILLPLSALSGLSAEQLEAVIAHELAHIKRFDAFVNLFQIGVETLLFYHPAVWWVSQSIRDEREHCCDDIAVSLIGNPLDYAKALTLMEEWRSLPDFALAINSRPLKSRIERLLGIRSVIATASAGWPLGGVAVMAFLGVTGLVTASGSLHSETLNILEQRFFNSEAPPSVLAPRTPSPLLAPRAAAPSAAMASEVFAPAPHAAERATPRPAVAPVAQLSVQYAKLINTATHTAVMLATAEVQNAAPTAPEASGSSHSYIADMDAAGYKNLSIDQLISLKIQGVTPEYVREVKAAGLNPDVNQLIGMKIQGVSPAYIRDMKAAGLDVDLNHLIAMKIQGVSIAYITDMRATGLSPSMDKIIAMKIQGVTPEYVHDIQASGSKNVTADQVIAMKIQGVKASDAAEFEKLGLKSLSIDDLIAMRIQGVSPSYIQGMRSAGYNSDKAHDYIGARIQGVTPEFIEKAKQHGFNNLTLHQLMALRNADVF